MSIATLKKKTFAKYNNVSANSPNGFSLNGTHRSQGYVGQTMLSRSLPVTHAKGNTLKGHGGCCGKFPMYPSILSGVTSTNDVNVVKSSVLGTMGMIHTKYRWILRPDPYATVKPAADQNVNDQANYINRLSKNTVNDVDSDACQSLVKYVANTTGCKNIYGTNVPPRTINKYALCETINKPPAVTTQTDYISERIHKDCPKLDKVIIAKTTKNTPFGCGIP